MIRIKTVCMGAMGSALLLGGCGGNSTPPAPEASDRPVRVGGSAEAYEVVELSIEANEVDTEFTFLPPSQTSGGIEGVKASVLDIGGVSQALAADEIGDQLTYVPLAATPLVAVVHDSVTGVSDLSGDQLTAIYKGDLTNWQELGGPDAPIVLLDFTEDENEKKVLRQAYLGDDLVITPDAIVFAEDDELVETAATTEFSFAVVPLEDDLADLPLTVLSLDDVSPSAEALQSGAYPMGLPLGLVVLESMPPEVQAFVEFAESSAGQQVLADADYVVLQASE